MKKLLISLFSLFLFGQLLGQAYTPFPKSNAVWREYNGAPFGDCQEYNYQISGDTIVNGMTFHKLQKTGYVSSYGPSFCNQIKYRYNFYIGAFRNDSLNKRVYFLPSGQTNDTILYDFNLKIGDTIPFWNAGSYHDTLIVSNVDSILVEGSFRSVFTMKNCMPIFPDSVTFIEGIGSNKGLIPFLNCDPFGGVQSLNCFKIGGNSVYPDTSTNCQVITSLNKVSERDKVKFYPNPTNGTVNITNSEKIRTIRIYSLQGQKVLDILKPDTTFKLPEETGIYFIRVELNSGAIVNRKVIKQ